MKVAESVGGSLGQTIPKKPKRARPEPKTPLEALQRRCEHLALKIDALGRGIAEQLEELAAEGAILSRDIGELSTILALTEDAQSSEKVDG